MYISLDRLTQISVMYASGSRVPAMQMICNLLLHLYKIQHLSQKVHCSIVVVGWHHIHVFTIDCFRFSWQHALGKEVIN